MSKTKKFEDSVHFVLTAKGGCGKTFVASLLAQYFSNAGANVKGFDTDQENRDFFAYKNLPVRYVDVMEGRTTIDQKKFDGFMESLLTESGVFVVDNGANTFTPLMGYLVENSGIDVLRESGKNVYLHCIVGGGDNFKSTKDGFSELIGNSDTPLILWLNEHFGDLVDECGVRFTESNELKQNATRIAGAVMLYKRNPQTFGEDIKKMNTARITFEEVMLSSNYALMEKQRLRVFVKDVYEQLDRIAF